MTPQPGEAHQHRWMERQQGAADQCAVCGEFRPFAPVAGEGLDVERLARALDAHNDERNDNANDNSHCAHDCAPALHDWINGPDKFTVALAANQPVAEERT